ncbi:hypothetical protein FB567DRAFT_528972 [Paraphoma chrysanthemicola]|uniref:Uncharacterized protein n=1 Tax=Paraphoma chrysanthemicola TaxID=798071 RepID=A0A8K0VX25_9PLEO|nr:hypothetical protein FB567DRAFT_528972 [Paraphoma chrysanthemicola]
MSSTYHIPFPRAFLAVNTPVKGSNTTPPADTVQSQQPDHGFLSNRAAAHPRTTSISSTASDSSTASVGAPPSPPAAPAVASPVLGAKVFSPLAVNAKHAPLQSLADMTPVARSAFLSNR